MLDAKALRETCANHHAFRRSRFVAVIAFMIVVRLLKSKRKLLVRVGSWPVARVRRAHRRKRSSAMSTKSDSDKPIEAGRISFSQPSPQLPHVSTRQYARIVHRWVAAVGLDSAIYGIHTMRRTQATLIYKRTKNLRAVQLLLGHSKLESTVRYLGIEVDDALEISEQTEIWRSRYRPHGKAGR